MSLNREIAAEFRRVAGDDQFPLGMMVAPQWLRIAADALEAVPSESEPTEAAKAYALANPLGGPANVFYAMADRIRAGEDYYHVLDDYGLQHVGKMVTTNADPQSGAAVAESHAPDETGDRGVAPTLPPALPHGPVGERFMRHHYGASGYVPEPETAGLPTKRKRP